MTNPALDELSVMTYLSYLKQATRIQKEGAPAAAAPVAAAAPEPEPEPVKAPEPEPEPEPVVVAASGGGANDGADKSAGSGSLPPPWERAADWRTYEVGSADPGVPTAPQ